MDGEAFGAPGVAPTWASSDKDLVTTALGNSQLWVTIGHGIVNEIYWPSTGRPETRDIGFYLLGSDTWVDLKRVGRYRLSKPKPTIPLLSVVHEGDDYRLTVEFLPDPWRDVLLMRYALEGPYRLGIIAAPHLGSTGTDNSAWVDASALYAAVPGRGLSIVADGAMADMSAGYVGASDGWQDLAHHGRFTYAYGRASRGNVALSASLANPTGVIGVGFGPTAVSGRRLARAAVAEGYDPLRQDFIDGWERWGTGLTIP